MNESVQMEDKVPKMEEKATLEKEVVELVPLLVFALLDAVCSHKLMDK